MSRSQGDDGRRARIRMALACVLAAASFLGHGAIALRLDALGVFQYLEILFAADAFWFLDGFAEGSGGFDSWGGRGWVHPNATNFVNPPVRLLAALGAGLPFGSSDAEAWRRSLAVAVAPVASGLQTGLLFALFLRAGLPTAAAALGAAFGAVTFSSLVFGSIPESYPLSGAAYALLFLLAGDALVNGRRPGPLPWLAVGVLLTGFTVTNLAFFALVFAASCHGSGSDLRTALGRTARLTAGVALLSAALAAGLSALYGDLGGFSSPLRQLEEAGPRLPWAVRAFPGAVVDTVVGRRPWAINLDPGAHVIRNAWDPNFGITYKWARLVCWQSLLVLVLLLGGAAAATRAPPGRRRLYALAGATLAANFALHLFYGAELFLYSQHWLVPLVILIGGWLELGVAGLAALAAAGGFVLYHNLGVVQLLLHSIAALSAGR